MLKFTDLVDKLRQYSVGLIEKDELNRFFDTNITVKTYIPITEKFVGIKDVSRDFNKAVDSLNTDIEFDYLYVHFDMCIMFNIVFKYTNLEVLEKHKVIEVYDLVMMTGLYDYIVTKCNKDFERFVKLCERATAIDSLAVARELTQALGTNEINPEDFEKIKDIIDEIDPEKMELMLNIQKMNDPMMTKIVDSMSRQAVKEVMSGAESSGIKQI